MIKMLALGLLFATVIAFGSATDAIMEVSISNSTIHKGESVQVKCRVTNFDVSDQLFWYKKQGEDSKVQMGSNKFLSDAFKDTGRYTIVLQETQAAADVTYTLEITDAQAEDSGNIGCEVPSQGIEDEFVKLTVLVPVQEVHLYGLNVSSTDENEDRVEYHNGQNVEFNVHDEYHFQCVAEGSNPQPDIRFKLDEESVTDKFQYKTDYEVGAGQAGLKQIKYTATSTSKTPITIAREQNVLEFVCEAFIHEHEEEIAPKSIKIIPQMKFTPVIRCPDDHITRPVLSINLKVECIIKSSPHPEDVYLNWTSLHGNEELLRDTDPDEGHYRMIKVDTEQPDEIKIIFEVDRLFPQAFRTYTLHARNGEGETRKNIHLVRDTSADNSGVAMTSSCVLLLTTLVSSWI